MSQIKFYESNWFLGLFVSWLIYAILISYYLISKIIKSNALHSLKPSTYKQFKAFIPYRFTFTMSLEIIIGAIFLLIPRLILTSIVMCMMCITLKICFLFTDLDKPFSPFQDKMYTVIARFFCWLVPVINNIYCTRIEVEPNFYPTFRPHCIQSSYVSKKKHNQIISNHTSLFDIFLSFSSYSERVAFVGKSSIKSTPLFGTIAQIGQCVFVDRKSKESKSSAFHAIQRRIQDVKELKSNAPLVIFPEGTRTTHQCLSAFMAGGFIDISCVKLQAMKYKYSPNDCVSQIMPFCLFYNHVTVTSTVLDQNQYQFIDNDQFKTRTQQWMAHVLGIEATDISIKDYFEFLKYQNDKKWLKENMNTDANQPNQNNQYAEMNDKKSE